MSLISRSAAVVLLLALLPLSPAVAAPTTATAEPHLEQITLAPQGPSKTTPLRVRTEDVEPGAQELLEVTVDPGASAAFSDVTVEPVELIVLGGAPADSVPRPCRRSGGKVFCSWVKTFTAFDVPALITIAPKASAKTGDSAEIAVTAKIGDGPVSTVSSVIQIGEGVDLVAGEHRAMKAAAGRTVEFTPLVRNASKVPVVGVILSIDVDARLLRPSSYRNCRYGFRLICTFDRVLEPGRSYALGQPVVLRPPADSVPGSAVPVMHEWMTKTDSDWINFGTPGKGGLLTLESLASSQAARPHPDDNFSVTSLTVTGKRRPILAAAGVRRTAAIGHSSVLSPGLANFGPGTLRPDLFPNNRLTITVRLPANVVADGNGESCSPSGTDDVRYCLLDRELGAGQRATFPIGVTVAEDCGDPGRVEFAERLPDIDGVVTGSKKAAELSVEVPGSTCAAAVLPITGPGSGRVALFGLVLLAVGLMLAVVRVRRPVCAHAVGEPGPDRLRKDAHDDVPAERRSRDA